jgi:hypothetical protein
MDRIVRVFCADESSPFLGRGFQIGLFCIMSGSTGQTGNPARARDVLLLSIRMSAPNLSEFLHPAKEAQMTPRRRILLRGSAGRIRGCDCHGYGGAWWSLGEGPEG